MTTRPDEVRRRDVIVVGASAGGIDMLPRLLQPLPVDLPASVVIVQHMAPQPDGYLVNILQRVTPLPVRWAEQGTHLELGRVYVAPPDNHLMFTNDHLALSHAARENHARPSIDKLFRSAAAAHGAAVIGVLLSGMLYDGVAGLRAIADTGGVAIVQDPEEAPYPDLPTRALLAQAADRVLPVLRIATALVEMAGQPVPPVNAPRGVAIEADLDRAGIATPNEMAALGPQSSISCPVCHGPCWEVGDEHNRRYRCYLGHVTSAREVLARGALEVEAAMWSAVRALGERATTLETLASDSRRVGHPQVAELYAARAKETRQQADLARRFMMDLVTE